MTKHKEQPDRQRYLFEVGKQNPPEPDRKLPEPVPAPLEKPAFHGAANQPTLFSSDVPSETSKLKRLPGYTSGVDLAYFALDGRPYAAKPRPAERDSVINLGIYELSEAGDRQISYGAITKPSDIQAGLFGYKRNSKWGEPNIGVISYGLYDEYLGSHGGKGFASRTAELLVEEAKRLKLDALFAEVGYDNAERRLFEDESRASLHILNKLGFGRFKTTDKGVILKLDLKPRKPR